MWLKQNYKNILLTTLGLFLFHPLIVGVIDLTIFMWSGSALLADWRNSVLVVWTLLDVCFASVVLIALLDSNLW